LEAFLFLSKLCVPCWSSLVGLCNPDRISNAFNYYILYNLMTLMMSVFSVNGINRISNPNFYSTTLDT